MVESDSSNGPGTVRIVVAGHICIDLLPKLPASSARGGRFAVAPGTLMGIGPSAVSPGGCVSNVGLALHGLGFHVSLMGKVGDDIFGDALLKLLAARSPAMAKSMIVASGEATSYSIVVEPPGIDRAFLHCSGANDTLTADDVPLDRLAGAGFFHFGYPPIMPAMIADDGVELARLMERVHGRGLTTSLDMSSVDPAGPAGRVDWPRLLERTLPHVDLFCPSLDELLYMIDRPRFETLASALGSDSGSTTVAAGLPLADWVLDAADRCEAWGAGSVAIKLGEAGLFLSVGARASQGDGPWREPGRFYHPCFRAEVVGTTGSGDCTVAGLLSAMVEGLDPSASLRRATAVGACSVEAADATSGVPRLERVMDRLAGGWRMRPGHPSFEQSASIRCGWV